MLQPPGTGAGRPGRKSEQQRDPTPPLLIAKGLLSHVPQLGQETVFLFMCLGGEAVLVVEHLPGMHKVLFAPHLSTGERKAKCFLYDL